MPATLASLRGWVCRVWCRPVLTLYTKTAGVFGSGVGMLGLLPTEEPPWPPDPTLRSGGGSKVCDISHITYLLMNTQCLPALIWSRGGTNWLERLISCSLIRLDMIAHVQPDLLCSALLWASPLLVCEHLMNLTCTVAHSYRYSTQMCYWSGHLLILVIESFF